MIIFQTEKDSSRNHLKDIVKCLNNQFNKYKNEKIIIEECSSFDEYTELNRIQKGMIIDYHETSEYVVGDYNYDLILVYLTNEKEIPISYYLFINVEKKFSNHTSLLSLRFKDLDKAINKYHEYQKLFDCENDVLLFEEIKKDILKNEWDLY